VSSRPCGAKRNYFPERLELELSAKPEERLTLHCDNAALVVASVGRAVKGGATVAVAGLLGGESVLDHHLGKA
jgi:hypothetical protein